MMLDKYTNQCSNKDMSKSWTSTKRVLIFKHENDFKKMLSTRVTEILRSFMI